MPSRSIGRRHTNARRVAGHIISTKHPAATTDISAASPGRSSGRFSSARLYCVREKLPAIVKNKLPAQSRHVAAREGYMTITPELRASCCSEWGCCSCFASNRARRNQVATSVELSKESRYSVGRKPDTCQTRERDERRQIYHRAFCGRRDRARASGAGCSRQRHGRVRPFLRRILHRQESGGDFRRVASVRA